MKFVETTLPGAYIITPERLDDERGFFARSFCKREFGSYNLNFNIAQCNISFNEKKGTLRGLHYQKEPYQEAKLVRCTRGAIYDVIVDMRPESSAYRQWISVELTGENRLMLYVPEGFAHGHQSLEDNTEVFYQMSQIYQPEYSMGIRWDDQAIGIVWPDIEQIISPQDMSYLKIES